MALAYGHGSSILLEYETTPGTLASGTAWKRLPVEEFRPGVDQPWERMDIVGFAGGREEPEPQRGILSVDPSVVVPVDLNAFGHWLRMLFGDPITTGTTDRVHTWRSGGATLPAASIEHFNAAVPNGAMRYLGCRANTLEMAFAFGQSKQSATIGMLAATAPRAAATIDSAPTDPAWEPFTGAVGTVTRGGTALGRVTGASLRFSNGLEKLLEANRAGAAYSDVGIGLTEVSGSIDVRVDDEVLLADSEGAAPISLAFGYSLSATKALTFTVHRAFLNRTSPGVRGRAGLQASFAYRGVFSASPGAALTVELRNQLASFT